jgi:hypothetical protein
MQNPRKHHYIPIFYLKQWAASDGKLVEFHRPYKRVKPLRKYPDATGYEIDLYSVPGLPSGKEQYLEESFMRPADQVAADALKLLLEGRDEFTSAMKSGWSRFIISLLHRNPETMRQKTRELGEAYQTRLLEIEASYPEFRSLTDPNTFEEFSSTI